MFYLTYGKFLISMTMPHAMKMQHASSCIPFSNYHKIAIFANCLTMQANNITFNNTFSKMPYGRFSRGHAHISKCYTMIMDIYTGSLHVFS